MAVGWTDDPLEQEADRTADQIARGHKDGESLQHEPLRALGRPELEHPEVDSVMRGAGRPLEPAVRQSMESYFGRDFSGVRVHSDDAAAAAADSLRANAFTAGRHIAFAAGKQNDRQLLAHELTHVVQQSNGSGSLVQCDKIRDDVGKVISPTLVAAQGDTATGNNQLEKRMNKRKTEIQQLIDELGEAPKGKQAEKAERLKKDLAKSLDEIVANPDHPSVNPDLRKDIIASSKSLGRLKTREEGIDKKWKQFDTDFVSQEVQDALKPTSITPAELKALIAKESGDLMIDDQEGKIAGIAQLGPDEEKAAGGKKGDRKDPHKAIVLCAKTLALKAKELDAGLTNAPTGVDRKKFIMASYNGGVNMVVQAQNAAISNGKKGKTWSELIDGGKSSALYAGIKKTYAKGNEDGKFAEVTSYITKIYERLTDVK